MAYKLRSSLKIGSCLLLAICFVTGCHSARPHQAAGHGHIVAAATAAEKRTHEAQSKISPKQALAELRAGNERFVAGKSRDVYWPEEVRLTAAHQYPIAAVLGCMDSRVPPEILFDQGLGDIFSIRVTGNVLNDDSLGSLEYACKVAGAKVIVVLGHSSCGAVKGAIDDFNLGHLTALLEKIKPAAQQIAQNVQPRTSKNKKFVQQVAENNVRLVTHQIRERSALLRQMLDAGQIRLVGAMYDLVSGEVMFISE
jgi:carbonic anhydrase